jgi:predicted DNA-binding transcriptional regulator AlpA
MATTSNSLEPLLDEHEVARVLNMSIGTIRRWRLIRQGPRYRKIGASVRYKPSDVSAWLDSRPSSQGPQAERN